MSEITKIEVQKKDDSRANLYVDEKFFAGISIELCMKHQLKKGMKINVDYLSEIILEDEKGQAINKAVKYLGSALKTKRQLRDYLLKKDYSSMTIDYVIEKMEEYKYLNDEAYCKAFVNTNSNKYGKIKLISMLKNKGVSANIIDKVFEEDVKLENSIDKVAEKYLKNKNISADTYIKLSRFLFSRGYEYEEINSYVKNIKNNNLYND